MPIDEALMARLKEMAPSVLLLLAIDEDGVVWAQAKPGEPVPFEWDGTKLIFDLARLVTED